MKIHSTLLLIGALAGVLTIAAPAASQPLLLRVKNPVGQLVVENVTPGQPASMIGALDIGKGLLEIEEGPVDENGRKLFALTRASLHLSDFSVRARSFLGDTTVPFVHVGLQLRDAVIFPGTEQAPQAPTGVFQINFAPGSFSGRGTPHFVMGARVHDSYSDADSLFDRGLFLYEVRSIGWTQGRIDLPHRTVQMQFVFSMKSGDPRLELRLTLTLAGDITLASEEGYGKNELPDREPTGDGGSPTKQPGGKILVLQ